MCGKMFCLEIYYMFCFNNRSLGVNYGYEVKVGNLNRGDG